MLLERKIWNTGENLRTLARTQCVYKYLSTQAVRVVLGTAPIIASFLLPLRKIIIVGMLLIPYRLATEGLSSVFSLKHFTLPAYCFDSSFTTGWNMRQGPHHEAQNSTTTGPFDLRTSDSHVSSVTEGTENKKSETEERSGSEEFQIETRKYEHNHKRCTLEICEDAFHWQ